jgi:ABC-type proline/glycine betaine transport system permease subunit
MLEYEEIQQNDKNRELLLSLLREYTEKLNFISSQIEQSVKFYQQYYFYICFWSLIIVITTIVLGYLKVSFNVWIFFVFWVSGMFVIVFIAYIKRDKINTNQMVKQSKLLAIKLERLVRTISQFQEHVEKNYAQKIELDLRLADAESALDDNRVILKTYERISDPKYLTNSFKDLTRF